MALSSWSSQHYKIFKKKKKSLRLQAVIYNLLVWHLVHDLERNLENKLPEDGRPKRSPCWEFGSLFLAFIMILVMSLTETLAEILSFWAAPLLFEPLLLNIHPPPPPTRPHTSWLRLCPYEYLIKHLSHTHKELHSFRITKSFVLNHLKCRLSSRPIRWSNEINIRKRVKSNVLDSSHVFEQECWSDKRWWTILGETRTLIAG